MTPVINALQHSNPNRHNITPNMTFTPSSCNTRHSPQFLKTQVLGITSPQHTPIIRNPYANKDTPNNSKNNNHTPTLILPLIKTPDQGNFTRHPFLKNLKNLQKIPLS